MAELKLVAQESKVPNQDLSAIWMGAFPKFWALYPRKIAKKAALKAWRQLQPAKYESFAEEGKQIIRLLMHFKRDEWIDCEPKRICYPATWLRQESFEASDVDDACGCGRE